ncbi:hypothetical protein CKF48_07365 [Cytobacillus kochii]|uniref:VPS28 C-terminal domain-containing protein n=1 Tax=Cytobacillus kochii TaxID=859143 RepID=A0A248TG47_9BACI|nr:hypothetical protein CKF48_07365 [Cytobacillus kochii]
MKNDDKISDNQSKEIISDIEEFYNKHNESIEQLKIVLMDLSKENLNETLDEIDRLYDENVSN